MDDAVFLSECGLDNIRVPLIHSVTDDIGFGGCIQYIMALLVVESRAYDVAILAAEIPCLACVGIYVYEDMESNRTNWVVIVVRRAVEVFPG